MAYADRAQAGDVLATVIRDECRSPLSGAVVLGLVRGGVPVAARVAACLGLSLDIMVIRKLGVPAQPELAFGAIGPGGVIVGNPEVARWLSPDEQVSVVTAQGRELARREALYRNGRPPLPLAGQTTLIVDDGLATGATARAAVAVAIAGGADKVLVAAPVGAAEAIDLVTEVADQVFCPLVPGSFAAVGQWYDEFPQVSDEEVLALLTTAAS